MLPPVLMLLSNALLKNGAPTATRAADMLIAQSLFSRYKVCSDYAGVAARCCSAISFLLLTSHASYIHTALRIISSRILVPLLYIYISFPKEQFCICLDSLPTVTLLYERLYIYIYNREKISLVAIYAERKAMVG